MNEPSTRLSRRTLLLATAIGLGGLAAPAFAAKRKKHEPARKAAPTVAGTPLTYPKLIDLRDGDTFDLVAEPATHAFLKDKPVAVIGYGGTYMGPALRLRRGTAPKVRLVNRLDRPTNVHWHGLLVEGRFDGGSHGGVAPGGDWTARLAVDQPAATLWYHAHVHGRTAEDVHDGLAGLLLVEDPNDAVARALPATWGVDDLPLVLQDRTFDPDGRPLYEKTTAVLEHGFHGATMIVNGIADAVARVPQRLVRLRLVNASGSRTFRLFLEDQRTFRLIATDAGLLGAPVDLTYMALAPGERAEILVDFAEGGTALMTGPDDHEHRSGARIMTVPDVLAAPARLVAFDAVADAAPHHTVPATLAALPALPRTTAGLKRRRFELRVEPGVDPHAAMVHAGMDHAAMISGAPVARSIAPLAPVAPRVTINGQVFDPGRIDEKVDFGAVEVWEIVSPEMAHPFHVHGAHFRVLGEDGGRPKAWNTGAKDTVLVENSAELLVTFASRADQAAPFVYHCHLLEHEDGGMMGTFTVA
ncbi:multicopper oxidase family protein [Siculibacillus lacustris]|nr:multicopper oxidase domain-containing protein [Siculibacillus lacustris]